MAGCGIVSSSTLADAQIQIEPDETVQKEPPSSGILDEPSSKIVPDTQQPLAELLCRCCRTTRTCRSAGRWPSTRRHAWRAHEDARTEPVSDAEGVGEHRNLHANLVTSIRQYARERMSPPQSGRVKLGVDSIHALRGRSGYLASTKLHPRIERVNLKRCCSNSRLPFYSNRVPTEAAQTVAVRLSLASNTSTLDFPVNSSPLAPSSKVALTFWDPTKAPLTS
jgi:hypothetical protein